MNFIYFSNQLYTIMQEFHVLLKFSIQKTNKIFSVGFNKKKIEMRKLFKSLITLFLP